MGTALREKKEEGIEAVPSEEWKLTVTCVRACPGSVTCGIWPYSQCQRMFLSTSLAQQVLFLFFIGPPGLSLRRAPLASKSYPLGILAVI